MAHNFISIHGIDGTGKSTAVLRTAERLRSKGIDAVNFAEALESNTPFHDILLSKEHGKQARLYKSLGTKSIQSIQIAAAIERGLTVIKDRWVIDVLAANSYEGAVIPDGDLGITKPDLSVILVCLERERQRRIQQRGNPTQEDLVQKALHTRAGYFEEYLLDNIAGHSLHHAVVDTTRLNEYQVAEEVCARAAEL